jgi:hypothetical protein
MTLPARDEQFFEDYNNTRLDWGVSFVFQDNLADAIHTYIVLHGKDVSVADMMLVFNCTSSALRAALDDQPFISLSGITAIDTKCMIVINYED